MLAIEQLSKRLRGCFDYLRRPHAGSENLNPDLKRSRLPDLIRSDVWPGVMLMKIRGVFFFYIYF